MIPAISLNRIAAGAGGSAHAERLDLQVEVGSFVVLQTTRQLADFAIRVCSGLETPAAGTVAVCGLELSRLSRAQLNRLRSRLGIALQPGGLISNQTLRMNLVVPLLFGGGVSQAEAMRRSNALLDRCGLTPWADRRPFDVSPDLRQVAVVARALVREPEVLLLGDPFATLDAEQSERLLTLARESNSTVLVATHRSDEALSLAADEIAVW